MTAITLQNRLHLTNSGSQSLPIPIIHVRRSNVLLVPKADIKGRLHPSTDATYLSLNGRQTYIRNFSIPSAVLYTYQEDKSIQTLRKLPVMSDYAGILVHDHETALYNFGIGHGECNVHLNRYLKKNTQERAINGVTVLHFFVQSQPFQKEMYQSWQDCLFC